MRIPLSQSQPGMMLSEDIIVSGGVLVNRNELLDDGLIRLLENCDITEVDVCEPEPVAGEPPRNSTSGKASTVAAPVQNPIEHSGVTLQGIFISVTPDRMSATLILDPDSGCSRFLDESMVQKALDASSVKYGIQMSSLHAAVDMWNQCQKRSETVIALGTFPGDATANNHCLLVPALSSRSEVEQVLLLKTAFEVQKQFPAVPAAKKGTVIASLSAEASASDGMDVLGNVLHAKRKAPLQLTAGENADISDDNRSIIARCTGIPCSIDDVIGIVPVDVNGSFSLEISPDNMAVRCKVVPPGPGGCLPGKPVLLDMLKSASVHEGISEAAIDKIFADAQTGTNPDENILIASGTPPVNGSDGTVTLHFTTETSLAPHIGSDGTADYKSVNIVVTTEKNRLLASLVPPGAGVDGHDVLGRVLPSQAGKPAKLPAGPNTIIDPDDPAKLLAGIDGIVRLTGGLVEVCEGFAVEGDVDFSTGNINYAKTVTIGGDVKSGFTVHTGGDLQVTGTIEDCHVSTGGNLLCKCGFIGSGKGIIESKGDVNLNFIKNQTVRSFKTITIAKEALSAFLYSRHSIIVHGKPLSVAGGELHAKQQISVYSAGNQTGIKTLLEVGVDYLMIDELNMIKDQITETMTIFKQVSDTFVRFQRSFAAKRPSPQELLKLKKLKDEFKQVRQKLSVLEERKSIVTGKLYTIDDARIVIEHAAYAGTLLKFGDRHHYLQEELIGPKIIMYTNHEITIH